MLFAERRQRASSPPQREWPRDLRGGVGGGKFDFGETLVLKARIWYTTYDEFQSATNGETN